MSRNKFFARRTIVAGDVYDSRAEAGYAAQLELQKKAGKILWWKRAARVVLIDGPTPSERVTYKPDFEVGLPSGDVEFRDVKGGYRLPSRVRINALLWRQKFPTTPLRFVDRDGNVIDLFKRAARKVAA